MMLRSLGVYAEDQRAVREAEALPDLQSAHDLHGGQHPESDADAVDGNGEQKRLHAPQNRRGLPTIPDFRQLGVGDDLAAAPEAGEDVDEHHVTGSKGPPLPVSGNSATSDHAGDVERRIDGKGRCCHGRAREPPRQRAPRHEVVLHRSRCSPREVGAHAQRSAM